MEKKAASFLNKLNSIYWHDGIFLEIHLTVTTEMSISLLLELYKDDLSPIRGNTNIQFKSVENLMIITNTEQLLENRCAGNIDWVDIEQTPSPKELKFSMNLFGGKISFSFKDVKIINS